MVDPFIVSTVTLTSTKETGQKKSPENASERMKGPELVIAGNIMRDEYPQKNNSMIVTRETVGNYDWDVEF